MPLVQKKDGRKKVLVFNEKLYGDIDYGFVVDNVLTDQKSSFQHILILDTERFGKVLVLDDIVQTSTDLEFSAPYGEMLAHVPLITHPNPQCGLIIGGGDFEVAREVLKHSSVKRLDLVDIDSEVSASVLCWMPEFSDGAEKDRRLHAQYKDGARFVKNARPDTYDFILVDSTDPGGPSTPLFSAPFVHNLFRILKPGGVMVRQVGSLHFEPDEAPSNFRCIQSIFDEAALYFSSVPIYWGGEFGFVLASKHPLSLKALSEQDIHRRFQERRLETIYYSPEIHVTSFVLPKNVQKRLETVYGWTLFLDIEGCDLGITDAEKECERFIKELCREIGMKRYGPFRYENFGHAKSKTSGPSFYQWIETSSISGHVSNYWDGHLMLDIFTCKAFDSQAATCFSRKFFKASTAYGSLVERGSWRNTREKKIHCLRDPACPGECNCRIL